jgi:fatty-acyl-CoA synthase
MLTKYDQGLHKRQANFVPLTPLHFLRRAADVFPDRDAVIYQDRRYSWRQYADRCYQLARALITAGVERGDTVSIIAPNVPKMLEAHFGVPFSGAVLNSINIPRPPSHSSCSIRKRASCSSIRSSLPPRARR